MTKQQAVIFDRDGTIASVAWCKPADRDSVSWHHFNGLLSFDAPVPQVVNQLRLVEHFRPDVHRFMFSGRAAGDRKGDWSRYWEMQAWLRKHDIPVQTLLMRRGGDQRIDSTIKSEMLDSILDQFDVICVVDDRQQVVDMWRERGVYCHQVVDPGLQPAILSQEGVLL